MRRSGRLPALLALALLVLPVPVVAQGTGPVRDRQAPQVRRGTASIVGRVVAADTGRPMRLVRVTAAAPEISEGRVAMTDENGAFELPELPAGRYTVAASKAGYIGVTYGQRRPLSAGRPVEVRDGQRVRDIDFRLPRGSAITGRVIDQDGEPLVRASIRTLRYRFMQGERRLEPGGAAETDDRGIFRVYGLTPGTYFVSAAAQAGDVAAMQRRPDSREASRPTESLTYAPTYYPGVAALSDAAPVTVGVSDEVAGVDFTLQLVTAARVTGIVTGPGASNAMVMLVPDDTRGMSGQTYATRAGRDGTFSILNVPPGRYIAIARGQTSRGENETSAVLPLTVSGSLTSDVGLGLAAGVTISGQVTSEGAATPSAMELARTRIGLWAPSSASLPMFAGQMNATPRPDGSFSVANVPAGARLVRVSGLQPPWTLKAVYLGGRDVTDEMIEMKPGEQPARITIVLTDKATAITGTVTDERQQPLTEVTVIAFPADSNLWRPQSRFIQAARSANDGTCTLRGLPPAEYLLCAIDDVNQGEWYDPELLEGLRAAAVKVLLQEGDTRSQDLKIVRSGRE